MSVAARGFPKVTPGMTYAKVGDLMGTPQQHIPRRELEKNLDELGAKRAPQSWCLAPLMYANNAYVLPECYVYAEHEATGWIRQYVVVFSDRGAVHHTYITRTPQGPGNAATWFPAATVAEP